MLSDQYFMEQAIRLALDAENAGNLPIGALIVMDGEVISQGENTMLKPNFHPGAHAEMVALTRVPGEFWPRTNEMTCYTTLEPCLMCFGSLLLHGVGRIVFGAMDRLGGAGYIMDHLPPFYTHHAGRVPEWVGPIMPSFCDPLYQRAHESFLKLKQLHS